MTFHFHGFQAPVFWRGREAVVLRAGLFDMALKNLGFLVFFKNLKSSNVGLKKIKT